MYVWRIDAVHVNRGKQFYKWWISSASVLHQPSWLACRPSILLLLFVLLSNVVSYIKPTTAGIPRNSVCTQLFLLYANTVLFSEQNTNQPIRLYQESWGSINKERYNSGNIKFFHGPQWTERGSLLFFKRPIYYQTRPVISLLFGNRAYKSMVYRQQTPRSRRLYKHLGRRL